MSKAVEERTESPAVVEEALAQSVMGIDAARRVGWAKAFEALRRIDGLEEENRILRAEKVALRRAYSRLLGFVQQLPATKSEVFNDEVALHHAAERPFRHTDAYDKGRSVADKHKALLKGLTEVDLERRRERHARYVAESRELLTRSRAAGHRTRVRVVSVDETYEGLCSCGSAASVSLQRLLDNWRLDHLSAAAGFRDFNDWKAFCRSGRTQ